MTTVTSQALPASGPPRPSEPGAPSGYSWLAVRNQATDKLCVRLSVSLRDRLNHAAAAVKTYPGAGVLRSRNVLIAYACHRLCLEADTHGLCDTDTPTPPSRPTLHPARDPTRDPARESTREGRAGSAGRHAALPPRWPPQWMAGAPLYRVPWESDLAEPRCQLTLRVPPPFAARLRALHADLAATPRHTRRPELASVHTFSDLVGLACHELCRQIEAVTDIPDPC